jgi:hypothetical protein
MIAMTWEVVCLRGFAETPWLSQMLLKILMGGQSVGLWQGVFVAIALELS